jgi:HD-GYP domain-containing protein (c-di-GMP phosphodiesterase class II)
VYNHNGLVLLTAGMKLTHSYIRRLGDLGIRAVDVQLAQFSSLRPREVLSPQLRAQATSTMRRVMSDARKHGRPDAGPVIPYVDRIVDQVLRHQEVMVGLTDIRAHDAYTHAHSVNVCMLSALIGRSLGYSRSSLLLLGMGAIMHDLGKVFIDPTILTQRTPLAWDQFRQVQAHAELGYQAMRAYTGIPNNAAVIALQHHERLDGSGYPHGVDGKQVGVFSRIVAVADVYDAVSSDRPYRAALSPLECIRLLGEEERGRLWPDAVDALLSRIAPFPEASTVRLSSGELAVVLRCTPHATRRPEIAVFTDAHGEMLPEPRVVRLAEPGQETLSIVEVLSMETVDGAAACDEPDRPLPAIAARQATPTSAPVAPVAPATSAAPPGPAVAAADVAGMFGPPS